FLRPLLASIWAPDNSSRQVIFPLFWDTLFVKDGVGARVQNRPGANGGAMNALSTTMMVDQPNGSEQRRSKIVPAARWVSVDYRSIVANAVAGLANNTPDA